MNPHGIRAFAPGRANLMGEHTDYNDGLCLPFAIDRGVTVTAKLRDGSEVVSPDLPDDDPYLRGAVAELRGAGIEVPGCSVAVASDLPAGAGPLVLGSPVRGAHARAVGGRPSRAARAVGARPALLADRERVDGRGDRPARPARLAPGRGGPRAAGSTCGRSAPSRSRSSCTATRWPCSTRAPAAASRPPATTSGATSAGGRPQRAGRRARCATPPTGAASPPRSTAASATS